MSFISPKSLEDAQNVLLYVMGGLGRNIMATAVVRNLKKAYPDKKLYVIGGNPDVFIKNPNVHRAYGLGNPLYLYEDLIRDSRTAVINVEPYQHYDYIYKRKHFIECWCDMIGIPCDSIQPDLYYAQAEIDLAITFLNSFKKDMVICQFEGGKIPESGSDKDRLIAKNAMYRRSLMPETQKKIVSGLIERGYEVGIVGHENQFHPQPTKPIWYPARAVMALLPHCAQVVTIDSFVQHASAALKKKSLVLWAGTSPDTLGYTMHENMRRDACPTPECHRPNSYLFDIDASGFGWECPFNNACTDQYDAAAVLKRFDEMTGGKSGGERKYVEVNRISAAGVNPYLQPYTPGSNGVGAEAGGVVATARRVEPKV